jgi:hypothetical protein
LKRFRAWHDAALTSPTIRKGMRLSTIFVYDWGMASLEAYLDKQLALGHSSFSSEEARGHLGSSASAFASAAHRLVKKHRLSNLRHEFYLILRPEDQFVGLARLCSMSKSTTGSHCFALPRFMDRPIKQQWSFR